MRSLEASWDDTRTEKFHVPWFQSPDVEGVSTTFYDPTRSGNTSNPRPLESRHYNVIGGEARDGSGHSGWTEEGVTSSLTVIDGYGYGKEVSLFLTEVVYRQVELTGKEGWRGVEPGR